MFQLRFENVFLESYALHFPEREVSSSEIEGDIAELYDRLRVPFGTLEKLSGIQKRRLWEPDYAPSKAATTVVQAALEKLDFDRSHIGALINCSVTRDYFEPATAILIHGNLNFPETTLAFDISNACIGFSNGIQVVGNLIEAGVIRAGIVVSAESNARIFECTTKKIRENPDMGRDELLALMPTFTIGCGAAAAVLCHRDIAKNGHRIVGCVSRTASQHMDLCMGNGDFAVLQDGEINPLMHTNSQKLISEAAKLGSRMFEDFSATFGWTKDDVQHSFCHQVGRQVNTGFYETMGLDYSKDFSVYSRYGNLVSAALPSAVFTGVEEKPVRPGEKMLLTAFGSGLNSIFLGIEW
jgi:3-oxoacyl-[acyl-carrier-protein] synthase-3